MEERVMAERLTPRESEGEAQVADGGAEQKIDWEAIENETEFQELVRARRSFVIPGTIFFLSWYMGFIVLTALAPDFMGERIYEGLTVGYVLALTQFLMVLVLGLVYLRKSENVFDPLAEKAIARYVEEHPDDVPGRPGSRFDTPSGGTTTEPEAVR
jgi:uncharacterized membrane protein (DUF485 family)